MCALPECYQRKAHSQGVCLVHFLEGYAEFSGFPETIWDHSGIIKDLGHDSEKLPKKFGQNTQILEILGI
jgi:hypothetical protein